jgi:hypothetical protein
MILKVQAAWTHAIDLLLTATLFQADYPPNQDLLPLYILLLRNSREIDFCCSATPVKQTSLLFATPAKQFLLPATLAKQTSGYP